MSTLPLQGNTSGEGQTVNLGASTSTDSALVTTLASSSNSPLLTTFSLSPSLAATILSPTPTSNASSGDIPSSISSSNSSSARDDTTTTPTITAATATTTALTKHSIFPVVDDDDDDDEERKNAAAGFECHICLDIAKDAVVSLCGHLFCWPCLHQWLETRPTVQLCPVCKAGISKDKVVPLYGRGGNGEQKDPRTKPPPPRPQGQRSEPESQGGLGAGAFGGWPGMIFGDGGSHLSFGIGAFPFAFFASAFNLNDGRPPPPEAGSAQYREERFLNRVFIVVSVLFAMWLVLL